MQRVRRQLGWEIAVALAVTIATVLALSSTAGAASKPRAFAFFNQYCTACKKEAAALGRWTRQVQGRYEVTGVGFRENVGEAREFADSLGLHFAVRGDPDGKLSGRLGVQSPTMIAVVRSGKVTRRLDYAHWPLPNAYSRKPGGRRKCRHRHRCGSKKKVVPHPIYAPAVAWQSYQPAGGFLLVRYLELSPHSRLADGAFAAGSQEDPQSSVRALSVICGRGAAAWRRLRAAGISAPVVVDEAADCPGDLNRGMAGIADPSGGPERLYAPNGRLIASDLNVNTTVTFKVEAWMEIPTILGGGYASEDSGALDVPVPANVQRSELDFSGVSGDLAVRGFWWLCPTCVGSEADYELEGWSGSHPGAQLVAATCDPNIHEAANFVVEHGWTFPVEVYDGPLDFATCFSQLMQGRLGIQWYGDQAYLGGGVLSSAAKSSFPGLPEG